MGAGTLASPAFGEYNTTIHLYSIFPPGTSHKHYWLSPTQYFTLEDEVQGPDQLSEAGKDGTQISDSASGAFSPCKG